MKLTIFGAFVLFTGVFFLWFMSEYYQLQWWSVNVSIISTILIVVGFSILSYGITTKI